MPKQTNEVWFLVNGSIVMKNIKNNTMQDLYNKNVSLATSNNETLGIFVVTEYKLTLQLRTRTIERLILAVTLF